MQAQAQRGLNIHTAHQQQSLDVPSRLLLNNNISFLSENAGNSLRTSTIPQGRVEGGYFAKLREVKNSKQDQLRPREPRPTTAQQTQTQTQQAM